MQSRREARIVETPIVETLILIYLWGALIEDAAIFFMSWFWPELWFRCFHRTASQGLEVSFLRRAAGQWLAFAIGQGIAITRWRKQSLWLVIVAVLRFSDLFTDISYVISAPALTVLGWFCLMPPPVLNLVGVVLMSLGYRHATEPMQTDPGA